MQRHHIRYRTNLYINNILFMIMSVFFLIFTVYTRNTESFAAEESAAAVSYDTVNPVTVCVLDSGCGQDLSGWNYVDGNDDLTDTDGHGTGICEILQDYAPQADIVMLKCFDAEIEANDGGAAEARIVQALQDAVDQYDADIISMSWTVGQESETLHDAVRYAKENGAVLVSAAGNLSLETPLGSLVYPAGWDEVIGVGGVDFDEDGDPVTSLWYLHSEAVYVSADGNWEGERGSSYAVPRMAGVIASYLQDHPAATEEAVRTYLREQAQDAGEEGYDTTFGWGVIM